MSFHHVALATNDLEATHAFYTDAMGFTLVEGPKGITYAIASGAFSHGTADAFERFDELNQRSIDVVVFDSPGGLILEAMQLGRYLRERGIATLVPDEALCASACPLAYAGGVAREAGQKAWIGAPERSAA